MRSERADSNGWSSLLDTFSRRGVNMTPLAPFATNLMEIGEWKWGTEDFDTRAHYRFIPIVKELLGEPHLPPGLTVSHDGHGVNSFGLTIRLITPRSRALVQTQLGGAYTSPEPAKEALKGMVASVASFAHSAEGRPRDNSDIQVLFLSRFRGHRAAGFINPSIDPSIDINQWLQDQRREAPSWWEPPSPQRMTGGTGMGTFNDAR